MTKYFCFLSQTLNIYIILLKHEFRIVMYLSLINFKGITVTILLNFTFHNNKLI